MMPSFQLVSRKLLLLCCMLICFSNKANCLSFLANYCEPNNTYDNTTGSPYRTNLNFLLSTLSSNASISTGFYNSTAAGRRNDPSNTIYGLFLCRGDLSVDVCKQCVDTTSKRIIRDCPNQKAAIVWYDECMLRYSNQYIFSRGDALISLKLHNTQNVTDPERFNELLEVLVAVARNWAANDTSGKKFFTEDASLSGSQRLYTLGQCTPDLSPLDCDSCLSNAISFLPDCCLNRLGGRVIFPSCNIRYEVYRFYNDKDGARAQGPAPNSPPPPLPPFVSTTSDSKGPSFSSGKRRISVKAVITIAVPISFSFLLVIMITLFLKRRSRKRSYAKMLEATGEMLTIDPESLQYNLSAIQIATNNFSVDNKIGEGGFGRVYKGTLSNGQEIAVKRLSRSSSQGAEEFKNEIGVVAKLQHRNLVRLLGFCLEGEERLLVYEFVPNKSLDYFLFDPRKQQLLDWRMRHKIIGGIARGLLYLHEDSRLRIVHRDLKAGNILLDESMNPKIADFGMAKICGIDQSEGNTNRIAGTFGYMAPEYTRSGQFSVKSDVFSFGVVILEIITGKKNSSFYKSEDSQDLLGYAWQRWRDGEPLALLDPTIKDGYDKTEVLRCIHIGLLCAEVDADRRPTMASVVYMLNGSSVTIPAPQFPAVSMLNESESISKELESKGSVPSGTVNEASFTELHPR